MNEVKRYMNAIERGLRMDAKTRARVMGDLASDFQNRRDAGQTDAEIMAELGTPQQAAAELNAAFAAEGAADKAWGRPSRWRWLFLALSVPAALAGLAELLFWRYMPFFEGTSGGSLGIIGGADGPTAIFVTGAPVLGSMGLLALFAAALSGFLILGWCRADRRRLWLPIALCAVPLAAAAFRLVRGGPLPFTPDTAALLPAAAVLVWAVWGWHKTGKK